MLHIAEIGGSHLSVVLDILQGSSAEEVTVSLYGMTPQYMGSQEDRALHANPESKKTTVRSNLRMKEPGASSRKAIEEILK